MKLYLYKMEISLILVSFLISTILHFSIQKIFIYYNKFDDFNFRSSHKTLATRTGGIGIFFTLFIISLFFYFNEVEIFDYSLFIPLGIMFIVGVYDDFYNADFKLKFFLQIIVAKILIDQGFVISNFHGFFGFYEVPWLFAQITTIFIFIVIVNALNFIDGIDGLAVTEVIKTILIIELFSSSLSQLVNLSIVVICSLLPLYYFNFKKEKKVFLGDAGSLFLGTLIAIYILYVLGPKYSIKNNFEVNKAFFVVIAFIYPLVDLFRVFILRIKDGKSPFIADKRHLHHLLTERSDYAMPIIISIEVVIFLVAICSV